MYILPNVTYRLLFHPCLPHNFLLLYVFLQSTTGHFHNRANFFSIINVLFSKEGRNSSWRSHRETSKLLKNMIFECSISRDGRSGFLKGFSWGCFFTHPINLSETLFNFSKYQHCAAMVMDQFVPGNLWSMLECLGSFGCILCSLQYDP